MDIWNAVTSGVTAFFTILKDNWNIVTNGVIAFFTLVMAIAAVFYAVISNRLYKVSKDQIAASKEQAEAYVKQTEAIKELSVAVTSIPGIFHRIELQKEMAERNAKERAKLQRRATGGH
jgi:hypothetical protein